MATRFRIFSTHVRELSTGLGQSVVDDTLNFHVDQVKVADDGCFDSTLIVKHFGEDYEAAKAYAHNMNRLAHVKDHHIRVVKVLCQVGRRADAVWFLRTEYGLRLMDAKQHVDNLCPLVDPLPKRAAA